MFEQFLPMVWVIGRTEDEYVDIVGRCSDLGVFAAIELNLSCPNLKQGGLDFGYDPETAYRLVKRTRAHSAMPIIAKARTYLEENGIADVSSLVGAVHAEAAVTPIKTELMPA